jgi:hypothetical protein
MSDKTYLEIKVLSAIDPKLIAAITHFQNRNVEKRFIDGKIDKTGRTLRAMNKIIDGVNKDKEPAVPPLMPINVEWAFTVSHKLKVIVQPKENSCWATLSTMFIKAKNPGTISDTLPVDTQVRMALATLPSAQAALKIYDDDTGMNNDLNYVYWNNNMHMMPFTPPGGWHEGKVFQGWFAWLNLMKAAGKPLVVNTRRPGGANHIVTLIGIDGLATPPNRFADKDAYPGGAVKLLDTNWRKNGFTSEDVTISVADLDFLMSADEPNMLPSYNRLRVFWPTFSVD